MEEYCIEIRPYCHYVPRFDDEGSTVNLGKIKNNFFQHLAGVERINCLTFHKFNVNMKSNFTMKGISIVSEEEEKDIIQQDLLDIEECNWNLILLRYHERILGRINQICSKHNSKGNWPKLCDEDEDSIYVNVLEKISKGKIVTYDGRAPLIHYLSVLIKNQFFSYLKTKRDEEKKINNDFENISMVVGSIDNDGRDMEAELVFDVIKVLIEKYHYETIAEQCSVGEGREQVYELIRIGLQEVCKKEKQQLIGISYFCDKMSQKQIVKMLNIKTQSTVSEYLAKIRIKLIYYLKKMHPELKTRIDTFLNEYDRLKMGKRNISDG